MSQLPTYAELQLRIEELKKNEIALKESEERFRVIFNSSADGHVLYQHDQFIDCNQAAIDMLGFRDKSQLLSLSICETFRLNFSRMASFLSASRKRYLPRLSPVAIIVSSGCIPGWMVRNSFSIFC